MSRRSAYLELTAYKNAKAVNDMATALVPRHIGEADET